MSIKGLLAAAGIAAGFAVAPAKADVTWFVKGTFDDGGTVSGQFTLNVYGYLESNFSLVTTGGGTLPGFTYDPSDSYYSNDAFHVDAQPGYFGDPHLTFANDLNVPSSNDPLVGGGQSWECASSYLCYAAGGSTRYITSGYATTTPGTVPEPST